MTRTQQPRSWSYINNAGEDIGIHKPQTEDEANIILSLIDDLNELYEILNRLNYIIQKRNKEQIVNSKNKG